MGWEKGRARGQKTGGRQAGTPNKASAPVEQMAQELGIDPLKVLFYFVAGDWKNLGYTAACDLEGKPTITADHRINAAKEAAQYLYPKKKALEISTSDGDGFQIVIKDYAK